MIEEAKIGDDLRVQQTHGVGRDRVAEARMKLFRYRRTTHDRSPLEDLDFEACHAEVGGASQPIVTGTDDDDVVGLHRMVLAKGASAPSGLGHGSTPSSTTLPVFSCEWNRSEYHRLQLPCARIMSIEHCNSDPPRNGSASGDIS